MKNLSLTLTIKIFKEGSAKECPFVAYNPEFDLSSCGETEEEASKNLHQALKILIQGAKEDGTLKQLLFSSTLYCSPKNL